MALLAFQVQPSIFQVLERPRFPDRIAPLWDVSSRRGSRRHLFGTWTVPYATDTREPGQALIRAALSDAGRVP